MSVPSPGQTALAAARVFELAHVPYVLGGSMASMVYGEIRGTLDVDFASLMREEHVEDFIRAARREFILDAEWIATRVAQRRMFQLLHATSFIKVDVYVRPDQGLYASEIRRAQRIKLGPDPSDSLLVASAEDTILQKLIWYREGGCISDRQWRDVLGVLKIRGSNLDREYMFGWSTSLELSELLRRALAQSAK